MGGTFDPQALMALLQGSQGNSQGLNPPPAQPSGQSDDYTNSVMGGGDQSQQAPPQNNAQNAGPVKAGLRGVLARMLGNFSYGAGQAMLHAAGDETDAEKATRLAQTAHLNAQTALTNAQTTMMQNSVPFTLPNGTTVHLPAKMATDLMKQQLANQGKVDAAGTSKRFMAVPNVGLVDTQHPSGVPTVVSGTNPTSVQVTPEIAQQYNIPQQLIGQTVPLQQFTGLERGGAAWAGTVNNTVETKEVTGPDGQPVLAQVPKTSSTRKVAPTAPGTQPAQSPTPNGQTAPPVKLTTNKGGVKFLTGPDGKPLMGKAGADVGPAYDPSTNQYIITNRADAAASGYQNFQKSTPAQIENDRQLNNRITDVQQKIDRYNSSFSQDLSAGDKYAMSKLMSDQSFEAAFKPFGVGVTIPTGFITQLDKAAQINGMSPQGVERLNAYFNAQEAMSGYQRVLTGSSRGNEHTLQLQLNVLPSPLQDKDVAANAFNQFRENLKIAGQGLPRMKGVQTPADVDQRFNQGQPNQSSNPGEPPRPANVPSNYVFNATGPKGAGWYKPR